MQKCTKMFSFTFKIYMIIMIIKSSDKNQNDISTLEFGWIKIGLLN